jgi:hypothetical protein
MAQIYIKGIQCEIELYQITAGAIARMLHLYLLNTKSTEIPALLCCEIIRLNSMKQKSSLRQN